MPLTSTAAELPDIPLNKPTPAASMTGGEQAARDVLSKLGKEPPSGLPQYQEDYERWKLSFNRWSYGWHLLSTVLIFFMVMGIVLFGLWLTWLQFTRDQRRQRRAPKRTVASATEDRAEGDEARAAAPEPVASSLKISATGVEVTSQVIGLLILGFSLAFFYLYVKEIYPIQITASKAPERDAKDSSKP